MTVPDSNQGLSIGRQGPCGPTMAVFYDTGYLHTDLKAKNDHVFQDF